MVTLTPSTRRLLSWHAGAWVWAHGCLTLYLFDWGVRYHDDVARQCHLKLPPFGRALSELTPYFQFPSTWLWLTLLWTVVLWRVTRLQEGELQLARPFALHILMQSLLIWLAVAISFLFYIPTGYLG